MRGKYLMTYAHKIILTTVKDRKTFLTKELNKEPVQKADSWKKHYFKNAAIYLNTIPRIKGSEIKDFCKKQGMDEPKNSNVWPAMLQSLVKVGWLEKDSAMDHLPRRAKEKLPRWKSKIYQP
jgi:hypothetical protein